MLWRPHGTDNNQTISLLMREARTLFKKNIHNVNAKFIHTTLQMHLQEHLGNAFLELANFQLSILTRRAQKKLKYMSILKRRTHVIKQHLNVPQNWFHVKKCKHHGWP